jgi:Flp pilus assembly protein TadG
MSGGRRLRRGACDRGSVTLEVVVLAPALLLLVATVIFAGRVAEARIVVQSAAAEAARAATAVDGSGRAAEAAAREAAAMSMAGRGLSCTSQGISLHRTEGVAVTADVTCVVDASDLAVPAIPGRLTVNASHTSPIDVYRGRP